MKENSIEKLLTNIGIKAKSQKVFLHLIEHGTSPVNEISSGISMPKSSVYDSLTELLNKSLVIEYNTDRRKEYGVIDIRQLSEIHKEQLKKLQEDHENLVDLIKKTKKVDNVIKPRITFYSGKEGIKQALRDNMWNDKHKVSYLMWPTKDMFEVMGLDFSIWHSEARLEHDVFLYCIHKHSDKNFRNATEGAKDLLNTKSWSTNVEDRCAPKGFDWKMSFWIYGDKSLFASGGEEKIAFVVHSKEFSELMLMLFKRMWNFCKPDDSMMRD